TVIERDLATDLDWQDVFSTQVIQSRLSGGASSYLQYLAQAVPAGSAVKKFYVPTLRGLFRRQRLSVTAVPKGYRGGEIVTVAGLGIDTKGAFFTAASITSHPQYAIAYNKNVVNGLSIDDVASCDNQSSSLAVNRTVYGVGDSFVATALLVYQGDILSAGGDEGAIGIASQIEHDLDCFWGTVEGWNPATGELVYAADDLVGGVKKAFHPQKLGTSRPLVNMNPAKWITAGKVQVIYPDSTSNGRIVGKGVPWDASVVGRFLAITDPTEHYLAAEANALGPGTGRDV